MRAQEYRRMAALGMSEKELQEAVVRLAKLKGWLVYHTFDSRRSEPGYPDLHLVHPRAGRQLFRELKSQRGRLTSDQHRWIDALLAAGADVGVWRPHHLLGGSILRELTL